MTCPRASLSGNFPSEKADENFSGSGIMETEYTKERRMMSILEFIEKQLKHRYKITEIQYLDDIHGEPELVVVPFDRQCSMDTVIGNIRQSGGHYSSVILFEEDQDQMDLVVGNFQKNGLDLICIREDIYGTQSFTRLDFEKLW